MALLLRKRGIENVRPLFGGLDGWRELGYPVAAADSAEPLLLVAPAVEGQREKPPRFAALPAVPSRTRRPE